MEHVLLKQYHREPTQEHTKWVNSCRFTSDGAHVVTASSDCTVKVRRVWGRYHLHKALSLQITNKGSWMGKLDVHLLPNQRNSTLHSTRACCSPGQIWSVDTGKLRATLHGHKEPVFFAEVRGWPLPILHELV